MTRLTSLLARFVLLLLVSFLATGFAVNGCPKSAATPNLSGNYCYLDGAGESLGILAISQAAGAKNFQAELTLSDVSEKLTGPGQLPSAESVTFEVSATLSDGRQMRRQHQATLTLDEAGAVSAINGNYTTWLNDVVSETDQPFSAWPESACASHVPIVFGPSYRYSNNLGDSGSLFITRSHDNRITLKLLIDNKTMELRGMGQINIAKIDFLVKAGEADFTNFSTLNMTHAGVVSAADPLTGQVTAFSGSLETEKKKPSGEVIAHQSGTFEAVLDTTLVDCEILGCYQYGGNYTYGDMTGEAGTLTIVHSSSSQQFAGNLYLPNLGLEFSGPGKIATNPWEVTFTLSYDLFGMGTIEMAHQGIAQAGLDRKVDLITGSVTIASYLYGDPNPIESNTVPFIAQK